MKKLLRIVSGIFAVVLAAGVITGCSSRSGESVPTAEPVPNAAAGGYVEEDISPDQNYNVGLFVVGDTLNAFTVENPATSLSQQKAHWYTMGPDAQWQEQTGTGFEEMAGQVGEGISYPTAYLTQEGKLYWSVVTITNETTRESQQSYFAVEEGKAEKIDALPEGEVAVKFDPGTNTLAVCGDTLLIGNTSAQLQAQDKTGAPVEMSLPELPQGGRLIAGNAQGYYILDGKNQIFHYTLGGTTAELVLDGGKFALSDPGYFVQSGAVGQDETLYFQIGDGNMASGNNRLLRYRWDSTLTTQTGGELTVFSLYRSDTVEAAINVYQKETGAQVSYTYALDETVENGTAVVDGSREDALTQLNTQLLAGSGPDVLILDDMPVDSFIEKGLLADLSDKVNTDGLLANMADVWKTQEGLFALPARCFPHLMGGAADTLAALDSAETLAGKLAQEPTIDANGYDWKTDPLPLVSYYNTVQLFDTFYPVYAQKIWENGELDETACTELYTLLGQIRSGGGSSLGNTRPFHEQDGTYYHPQNGTSSNFTNAACQVFCESVYNLTGMGGNFYYHATLGEQKGENAGEVKALKTADGATSIRPSCVAGVNVSSRNQENAFGFLQTLLSQQVQEQSTYDGVPVLKTAILVQWEESFAENGTKTNTDIVSVLEGMEPNTLSTLLRNAVGQGAQLYLDGGSMEQALEEARQAASLWLAEQ